MLKHCKKREKSGVLNVQAPRMKRQHKNRPNYIDVERYYLYLLRNLTNQVKQYNTL